MALDLSNLVKDNEYLFRSICAYKQRLNELFENMRTRTGNDPDAWTVFEENNYKLKVMQNLELLFFFSQQLKGFEAVIDADKETIKKLLPQWEQINKDLQVKIDAEIRGLKPQIEDTESKDNAPILKKKTVPIYTVDLLANRRPMGKGAGHGQFEIPNLIVPPPPCRIRFVYRDNAEPIANGTVLYWAYDNAPGHETKMEDHTVRFTKYASYMVPAGVCHTGPDGYALPGAPFHQSQLQFGMDVPNGQFGVSFKPDAKFGDVKTNISLAPNASMEQTRAYTVASALRAPVNNVDEIVSEKFAKRLFHPNTVRAAKDPILPIEQILESKSHFEYTEVELEKIRTHPAFKNLNQLHPEQKPPELSLQYFQFKRTYGFMAYPVHHGPFVGKPIDQLGAVATEGSTPTGTLAPENDGHAMWKGPIGPNFLTVTNGMYEATIALHSTLPEWDRRLNRQLDTLIGACRAYHNCISGHAKNLQRVRNIKKAADLYHNYSYENKGVEDYQRLFSHLDTMESKIEDQMEAPEDNSKYCGIADAKKELEIEAEVLVKILESTAFCDELQRYMDHVFGDKDGHKDGLAAPGPYMEVEPYWNNIFLTLTKCYAALKESDLVEDIYERHVSKYLFGIAKQAEDMDLDAGALVQEIEGYNKQFEEPDKTNPKHNRLDKLMIRLETIKDNTKIPEDKPAGPLRIMLETFHTGNKFFLRVPGPPSAAQALIDLYYDYFYKDLLKHSKNLSSTHILLMFGWLRHNGLITSGKDLVKVKNFVYRYIRGVGRLTQPGTRNKLTDFLIAAKDNLDSFIDDKFPNRHEPTRRAKSDDVYDEFIHRLGSKAHGFKIFFQVINMGFSIEAYGNMIHTMSKDPEKALLYTAKVMGQTVSLGVGAVALGGSVSRLIRPYAASWQPTTRAGTWAKNTTQKIDIKIVNSATRLDITATGLAYFTSAIASIEAIQSFQKGDTSEGIRKVSDALGEGAFALGSTMKSWTVKKTVRFVGGKAAGKALAHAASWFTGVGAIISAALILYDLACLFHAASRSQIDRMVSSYWDAVDDSLFRSGRGEKRYYDETYFSAAFGGAELEKAYDAIESLHKTFFGLTPGVAWKKLNWRAIIPMHRMGFGRDTIKKSIEIGIHTSDYENMASVRIRQKRYIEHRALLHVVYKGMKAGRKPTKAFLDYDVSWTKYGKSHDHCKEQRDAMLEDNITVNNEQKAEYNRIVDEKVKKLDIENEEKGVYAKTPMTVGAIIDYYEVLIDPSRADEKFDSDKTYETVANELVLGIFTPDKTHPENLPPQIQCINISRDLPRLCDENPDYTEELLSHAWGHEVYRQVEIPEYYAAYLNSPM